MNAKNGVPDFSKTLSFLVLSQGIEPSIYRAASIRNLFEGFQQTFEVLGDELLEKKGNYHKPRRQLGICGNAVDSLDSIPHLRFGLRK